MKYPTIGLALIGVVLALPVVARADDIRQRFEEVAVTIADMGRYPDAAAIQAALDATSNAELEQVYRNVDLDALVESAGNVAELQGDLAALDAETAIAVAPRAAVPAVDARSLRSSAPSPFPTAAPPTSAQCPPGRTTGKDLDDVQVNINRFLKIVEGAELTLKIINAVRSASSRPCDQVTVVAGVGGNIALACLPADILASVADAVLAAAKFGLGIWQNQLNIKKACDSGVDSSEIAASYLRLEHIHADLEASNGQVQAQIEALDAKLDLVLRVLLENDLYANSGRTNVNQGPARLAEVCQAAEDAISDALARGYEVSPRAQELLDLGRQAIEVDPRKAFDRCQRSYRTATRPLR